MLSGPGLSKMSAIAIKLGLVAGGGALGALLRYGLTAASSQYAETGIPCATLAANLIGSLLIGLLWAFAEEYSMHRYFVPFVFVGVLGSFTTFSTYALEGFTLLRGGQQLLGFSYMIGSNLGALLLVLIGYVASRSIIHSLQA